MPPRAWGRGRGSFKRFGGGGGEGVVRVRCLVYDVFPVGSSQSHVVVPCFPDGSELKKTTRRWMEGGDADDMRT